MKKIIVSLCLFVTVNAYSQFKVTVEAPASFKPKEAYLYSLNGSKDILETKENRKGNQWEFKVKKSYNGMMKLFFAEQNTAINFISENKDVKIRFDFTNGKIGDIEYLDQSNSLMNNLQDIQQKKEYILPALFQIKSYYQTKSDFGKALEAEINRLENSSPSLEGHPFVAFYNTNYAKYVEKNVAKQPVTHIQIIDFLTKSNEMLESSSLLRPVLVAYLNIGPTANLSADVDTLLKEVNTETPRGQTVLSELIEIFDAYDMKALKEKYLTEAKNLKCTINDRLAGTISTNKNTEIGATFPAQPFNMAQNTTAKTLADVKADKKVIIFWSSTCSHCEAELPKLLEKYADMKSKKIEIIGLSLDSDREAYTKRVKDLPWINDSELRGWNSTYVDKFNVHATPTYYILDSTNKIIAKPDHATDVFTFLKLN